MSGRPRALPPWMEKKKQEVKKKEPLENNSSMRRKRKAARAVFYCMNEKELVEAAVSFLTNGTCEDVALLTDQKVEAGDTTVKVRENPVSSKITAKPVIEALVEESSDCSDALEMTYVSETDLDITEMETVPYTKSQQQQEPEGQRSGPVQDHSGLLNAELEAEKREKHLQVPADAAEEDDALRLVREIFFT
ncbi:uncharacterized protein si:ch211-127m7.2 [Toxotes jaculatrix]|uniref:uncharacterized protein si:ch211-127m7.2 n=1 Tax=Toxotes jaculatrix TaxID=941984 RepID=UPI001B3ACCAD|nr:uncharacterized protein si:ch211-127m7.2 [Toxotes jaculatrix]